MFYLIALLSLLCFDILYIGIIVFFLFNFVLWIMDSINLNKYVQNWLFLKNLDDSNWDLIVYLWEWKSFCSKIDDTKIPLVIFPDQKKFGGRDFVMQLDATIESYDRVLLILDDLVVDDVIDLLKQHNKKCLCVVNLSCGLASFGHKMSPEVQDINKMLNINWNVREPVDFVQFFDLLRGDEWNNYIRLTWLNVSGNLMFDEEERRENQVFSFEKKWFSGGFASIVAMWSSIVFALRMAGILQEQNMFVDVFAMSDLWLDIDEVVRASILRSEKLVILLDHEVDEELLLYYSQILKDSELLDINVMFLAPDYTKLTTIFTDFAYDQVWFWVDGMVEKIVNKI